MSISIATQTGIPHHDSVVKQLVTQPHTSPLIPHPLVGTPCATADHLSGAFGAGVGRGNGSRATHSASASTSAAGWTRRAGMVERRAAARQRGVDTRRRPQRSRLAAPAPSGPATPSCGSSRHRASIVTGIDRPGVTLQPDKSGVVVGARMGVARLLRLLSRKSQRMRHPADTHGSRAEERCPARRGIC